MSDTELPVLARSMAAHPRRRLPIALRAFGSGNFSLYWFGLVVSQIGTWMQKVAEGWLIYRLTNSPLILGVTTLLSLAPLVPISLLAGVMADRVSRRKLLLVANVGQIVPPLILALLTWTGNVQVWQVVVADFFLGAFAAIDLPTRHALVVDVVPSEDVDNAISLSASGLNATRIIGPAIAGVIVAVVGEAVCFGLNGISFLAVVAALVLMRVPERTVKPKDSAGASLFKGFSYLARDTQLLLPLGWIVFVSVFIIPYQTLLPVFARDVLHDGATALGFLNMAAGIGAVLGALAVASLRSGKQSQYLAAIIILLAGVTAVFAASGAFPVSFAMMIGVGAGVVAIKAIAYTLIQQRVDDEYRGRVLSIVTMLSGGMPAVGGFTAGLIAARWGAPLALIAGAVAFLAICLVLLWRTSAVAIQNVNRSLDNP